MEMEKDECRSDRFLPKGKPRLVKRHPGRNTFNDRRVALLYGQLQGPFGGFRGLTVVPPAAASRPSVGGRSK